MPKLFKTNEFGCLMRNPEVVEARRRVVSLMRAWRLNALASVGLSWPEITAACWTGQRSHTAAMEMAVYPYPAWSMGFPARWAKRGYRWRWYQRQAGKFEVRAASQCHSVRAQRRGLDALERTWVAQEAVRKVKEGQ